MNGPSALRFSFNPSNGNVILTVEGVSIDIDIDADVSAAWFLPITIESLIVDNLSFTMEASGRKNDPNCWVPVTSKTHIDDFDVIIKQGITQRTVDRFHGTILDSVNELADMMVPVLLGSIIEFIEADF